VTKAQTIFSLLLKNIRLYYKNCTVLEVETEIIIRQSTNAQTFYVELLVMMAKERVDYRYMHNLFHKSFISILYFN